MHMHVSYINIFCLVSVVSDVGSLVICIVVNTTSVLSERVITHSAQTLSTLTHAMHYRTTGLPI
jgi:hypothetical protein